MELSARWGCESLVMFTSKHGERQKKLQVKDWEIVEEGEFSGSSVYSTKGSISASSDSSPKDETRPSNFTFEVFEDSPGDFNKKMEQTKSPPLNASVGSLEPLMGLKLGKRTYFENNNVQSSSSVAPVSKRTRPSSQISRCQVEGCNLDLSSAKQYHKKHRVCDEHSKCPKVIVGGMERRFCQQCSRFHSLSEFDEKKRSCCRRLSDHNARRRNPRRESIQFQSTRLSPSFYDDRLQMNFVVNHQVPLAPNSTWDSHCSKLTIGESEPEKTKSYMPGIPLPNAISAHGNAWNWNWPLTSKDTTAQVFNQGAMFPSNESTTQEFARALSLLSTPSQGSLNSVHANQSSFHDPMLHAIHQGLPFASSEYWQPSSTNFRGHTLVPSTNNGSLFSEIQPFKAPGDTDLYFNALRSQSHPKSFCFPTF